jgi:hypothetical protein
MPFCYLRWSQGLTRAIQDKQVLERLARAQKAKSQKGFVSDHSFENR